MGDEMSDNPAIDGQQEYPEYDENEPSYVEPKSSEKPFIDPGVSVVVGINPVSKEVIVHKSKGLMDNIKGALLRIFKDSAEATNTGFEVQVYSKEEFAKAFPDFEEQKALVDDALMLRKAVAELSPEQRKNYDPAPREESRMDPKGVGIVTLGQYRESHALIDGNVFVSSSLYIKGVETDMEGRMKGLTEDVNRFKQGLDAQQSVLDHHKGLLIDNLTDERTGKISLKVGLKPTEGMDFENEREFLEEYSIDDVAILVAEDGVGGIANVRHPEEGGVGKKNDAFVYRTKEQLDEMQEDGKLITSNQLGEDMLTERISLHDRLEAIDRLKEMGYNWNSGKDIGGDLEAYESELNAKQDAINSQMGALPAEFKDPQVEEPASKVEAPAMMQ